MDDGVPPIQDRQAFIVPDGRSPANNHPRFCMYKISLSTRARLRAPFLPSKEDVMAGETDVLPEA